MMKLKDLKIDAKATLGRRIVLYQYRTQVCLRRGEED